MVDLRGIYQELSLMYGDSFAHRWQKTFLRFAGYMAGMFVFFPDPMFRLLIVIFFAIAAVVPPVVYVVYYLRTGVILYGFKCRKLRDGRRQDFRNLSIRRYGDTVFKTWVKFPLGASSWCLRFVYSSGVHFEGMTTVGDDLSYQTDQDSLTVCCNKPGYVSLSLEFRISCACDLPLDLLPVDVYCSRNNGNERQVQTIAFNVNP